MAFDLPEIETDRLLLRKVAMTDVKDIYAFTSNPEGKEFLSWEPHDSLERTKGFVSYLLETYEDDKPSQWVIELKETNVVIGITGYVDYSEQHKRGEIAYIMSPDYAGKGYMTEANKAVVDYGLDNMGLNRVQAKAEVDNIGSQKVLEKIGMAKEGVLKRYIYQKGRFRDYVIYGIIKN